jgi:hypothetical protein
LTLASTAHLGRFLGDDKTPDEYDGLLAYAFKRDDIEHARCVAHCKWWDYRALHPTQTLFLFAHHYSAVLADWRTKFGVNAGYDLKLVGDPIFRQRMIHFGYSATAITGNEMVHPQTRTGFWRSMSFADSHGVPYEKWINWAFQFAFERQWSRMPGPGLLAGNEIAAFVIDSWEVDKANLMTMPKSPDFAAENYVGHERQDGFQDWLLGYINQRPHPHLSLGHYLAVEPLLDLDRTTKVLGEAAVGRALQHAR